MKGAAKSAGSKGGLVQGECAGVQSVRHFRNPIDRGVEVSRPAPGRGVQTSPTDQDRPEGSCQKQPLPARNSTSPR